MYARESLKKYLDDLAARLAAPGGGSAAAMSAALGAALISMVVNFTLGKPKYLRFKDRLKKTLSESEKLRKEFLRLVDADVEAFRAKDLKKSLDIPARVCALCLQGMKLCPDLTKIGNVNLISDVAVACALLESGFSSACFNVEINLKYLKGKDVLVKKLRLRMKQDKKIIRRIREGVEEKVGKIIRS